jgi:hypothetical protein
MAKQSKAMTPEEFIHDVSGIGLWFFVAILLVLATAMALETFATL